MNRTKVFGIGFHKTGTTSLGRALSALGYRVTGPNFVDDVNIEQNVRKLAYALAKSYDAFQDNPWPILYQELDQRYPGSKFVLTLRPAETWMKSLVRHFGTETTPMRQWIYGVGCPAGHEAIYLSRYEQHNRDVLSYFSDRPDDLLVLNITEGEGWEKLCPFVGKSIPDIDFPRANRAEEREWAELTQPVINSMARVRRIPAKIRRKVSSMMRSDR